MLYDWIHHRKKGAPKVTKDFEQVVRRQGTDKEHLFKEGLIKRSKFGGVRFAIQKSKKK